MSMENIFANMMGFGMESIIAGNTNDAPDALTVAGFVPSDTSPSGLTIAFNHNPPVNKKSHKRRNKIKRARARAKENTEYAAKRRSHLQSHQTKSFNALYAILKQLKLKGNTKCQSNIH